MNELIANNPRMHVRFNGRSFDLDLNRLDVGPLSSDDQIRTAVAAHLDVPVEKLQVFDVDRNTATGDMTLRPAAVFA